MGRFAKTQRVFFLEEPLFEPTEPYLKAVRCPDTGVHVITPVLRSLESPKENAAQMRRSVSTLIQMHGIENFVLWYYTPMARQFSSGLKPAAIVYDCMDELSAFAGAPPELRNHELALFQEADLVFTGGASLYRSKRTQHPSVHLFPSSVDVPHFSRARTRQQDPEDQAHIPFPRLGYAGVIDERMDIDLLRNLAAARPDWHFVLLGPVVKIDPRSLPKSENIHYLGLKSYSDLPAYLSGWQIGMLPFALNESTRFISPTKTPEYLAAGLRVISTPIQDVVSPYGEFGLVDIARNASEFIRVAERSIKSPPTRDLLHRIDNFLSHSSWDKTWSAMNQLIREVVDTKCATRIGTPDVAQATAEGMAHV